MNKPDEKDYYGLHPSEYRQALCDYYKQRGDAAIELLREARTIAEWHVQDSDECGTLARSVIQRIDSLLGDEP